MFCDIQSEMPSDAIGAFSVLFSSWEMKYLVSGAKRLIENNILTTLNPTLNLTDIIN